MVLTPQTPEKDYSMDELKGKYDDITLLYDYAEELVSTVESQFVQDPDAQMLLVEPLINEVSDAADILGEEFITIAESQQVKGKKMNKTSKTRVEGALRKIYIAINEYQSRAQASSGKAKDILKNIADPIVSKIQRQVEQIIVLFLDFVQISLHNIMNKTEAESLRVRNTHIAMLMHQQAISQQQ